jgi:hypothetical protein
MNALEHARLKTLMKKTFLQCTVSGVQFSAENSSSRHVLNLIKDFSSKDKGTRFFSIRPFR